MTDFNDNDYEFLGMLDRIGNVADILVQSAGGMDRADFVFDDDDWRMFITNQWIVNAWIEHIRCHYDELNWEIYCNWEHETRQLCFNAQPRVADFDVPDAEAWWERTRDRIAHIQPTICNPATDEDIQMTPYDASHSMCPIPASEQGVSG